MPAQPFPVPQDFRAPATISLLSYPRCDALALRGSLQTQLRVMGTQGGTQGEKEERQPGLLCAFVKDGAVQSSKAIASNTRHCLSNVVGFFLSKNEDG